MMEKSKTILHQRVINLFIEFIGTEGSVAPTKSLESMDIESGIESGIDCGQSNSAGFLAVENISATEDELEEANMENSFAFSHASLLTTLKPRDPVSALSIVPNARAP